MSASNKMSSLWVFSEPRSAVSVKPRHPRGGPDKRRPVIGPMPRPPPKEKPPPQMPEGRGRGMRDRDDRGMARGRGRGRPREGPIPGYEDLYFLTKDS